MARDLEAATDPVVAAMLAYELGELYERGSPTRHARQGVSPRARVGSGAARQPVGDPPGVLPPRAVANLVKLIDARPRTRATTTSAPICCSRRRGSPAST